MDERSKRRTEEIEAILKKEGLNTYMIVANNEKEIWFHTNEDEREIWELLVQGGQNRDDQESTYFRHLLMRAAATLAIRCNERQILLDMISALEKAMAEAAKA